MFLGRRRIGTLTDFSRRDGHRLDLYTVWGCRLSLSRRRLARVDIWKGVEAKDEGKGRRTVKREVDISLSSMTQSPGEMSH